MSPSPAARGIDASGTEVQLPVPSEDTTVTDANGLERRVYAGQPVPRDLLDAYNEQVGGGESDEDGEESGDDLADLTRPELDKRAAELGVEDPDKLPNKDAVIEAIAEAANDGAEDA